MRIRRARPGDAAAIHSLIVHYAGQGILLPRTREEVRGDIPNFLVAEESDCLAGCVALDPYGGHLAEIRSLAVAPELRGSGLGGRLLDAVVKAARRRRFERIFAVTHATEFFEGKGFHHPPGGIPAEKAARDCAHCPRAGHCRLRAVTFDLAPTRALLPVIGDAAKAPLPA